MENKLKKVVAIAVAYYLKETQHYCSDTNCDCKDNWLYTGRCVNMRNRKMVQSRGRLITK